MAKGNECNWIGCQQIRAYEVNAFTGSACIVVETVAKFNFRRTDSSAALNVAHSVLSCIQKFPDWPPGARTVNGTALCHWVQLYRYFVTQFRAVIAQ
jgi:hypothetical protein